MDEEDRRREKPNLDEANGSKQIVLGKKMLSTDN